MKKTVVIIGAGFAGLTLLDSLSRFRETLDIKLIDQKGTSDFLPLLPDAIGRGVSPRYLERDTLRLCKNRGIEFIKKPVSSVNLDSREVILNGTSLKYDYLVIASGSQTNFYGNNNIENSSYKIDSVDDADKLLRLLRGKVFKNYIIAGGGYTGIEVATNLELFLRRHGINGEVVIVERSPSILGPLPEWMKKYVLANLSKLKIKVIVQSALEKIESDKVHLAGGIIFDSALVVWAAGVRTADFIQHLPVKKNPQGRLEVDEYLRLNDNCFVAGDASYVAQDNVYLRMAVQFSISQAKVIAKNIINMMGSRKLIKYEPLDLGYIIPMANNTGCGSVFGLNIKGLLSVFLHYTMCIYRTRGLRNKLGIVFCLLKGGR